MCQMHPNTDVQLWNQFLIINSDSTHQKLMRFAFIVTGSIFLQWYWVSDRVRHRTIIETKYNSFFRKRVTMVQQQSPSAFQAMILALYQIQSQMEASPSKFQVLRPPLWTSRDQRSSLGFAFACNKCRSPSSPRTGLTCNPPGSLMVAR